MQLVFTTMSLHNFTKNNVLHINLILFFLSRFFLLLERTLIHGLSPTSTLVGAFNVAN